MEPSYTGSSSDSQEPESPTPSSAELPTGAPRAEGAADAAKPPAANDEAVKVGTASALRLAESADAGGDRSTPAAVATSAARRDLAAADPGALPSWVVVVLGLMLACVGVLGARSWRRHRRREQLAALWDRRNDDWDAAISQIRLERTPAASGRSAAKAR